MTVKSGARRWGWGGGSVLSVCARSAETQADSIITSDAAHLLLASVSFIRFSFYSGGTPRERQSVRFFFFCKKLCHGDALVCSVAVRAAENSFKRCKNTQMMMQTRHAAC